MMAAPGLTKEAGLTSTVLASAFGPAFESVTRLAEALVGPGVERGLIGPREPGRIWSRHLLNCAVLAPLLPAKGSVLDIGSGAGLPGLVLAAMCPDLAFELVDSMRRRTDWLSEMISHLDLSNVAVTWSRVEDLAGSRQVTAIISRAVGALDRLGQWGSLLLEPGGVFLALKGESAAAELAEHHSTLEGFGLVELEVLERPAPGTGELTRVVRGVKPAPKRSKLAHTGGEERTVR
jgi:16S rRNA (guanine527-N7)-methyltransferase